MDEIVWAVNPVHDSLDSLANYLVQFAQSILRAAGIACRLEIPLELPDWKLSAETRHNIFLASKEAISNAAKHSHAKTVELTIKVAGDSLEITVADDGQGMANGRREGHGLHSMEQRVTEVGGTVTVNHREGGGLLVCFDFPKPGFSMGCNYIR
jgi:signal transduction histidine kinase